MAEEEKIQISLIVFIVVIRSPKLYAAVNVIKCELFRMLSMCDVTNAVQALISPVSILTLPESTRTRHRLLQKAPVATELPSRDRGLPTLRWHSW